MHSVLQYSTPNSNPYANPTRYFRRRLTLSEICQQTYQDPVLSLKQCKNVNPEECNTYFAVLYYDTNNKPTNPNPNDDGIALIPVFVVNVQLTLNQTPVVMYTKYIMKTYTWQVFQHLALRDTAAPTSIAFLSAVSAAIPQTQYVCMHPLRAMAKILAEAGFVELRHLPEELRPRTKGCDRWLRYTSAMMIDLFDANAENFRRKREDIQTWKEPDSRFIRTEGVVAFMNESGDWHWQHILDGRNMTRMNESADWHRQHIPDGRNMTRMMWMLCASVVRVAHDDEEKGK